MIIIILLFSRYSFSVKSFVVDLQPQVVLRPVTDLRF